MPNYCNNYLTIEGNRNTMESIIELVKSEENVFDFEKIVPMPDYIYRGSVGPEEREAYGENNWYDWSCKNWGTKLNSVDSDFDGEEFYFLTAWSPCEPVIAALAKMFPTMRFTHTFYETGMCFCGQGVYENGELIFYYDGEYAESYEYEYEDSDYTLCDELFPIMESGIFEELEDVEAVDNCIRGKLHYREYMNNKIFKITDGFFMASKDYTFKFAKAETELIPDAA